MPSLRCARYVLTEPFPGSSMAVSDLRRLRLHRRTGKRLASEAPQAEAAAKAGHANFNSP